MYETNLVISPPKVKIGGNFLVTVLPNESALDNEGLTIDQANP